MNDWRTQAACLGEDPELFFPHPSQDRIADEAKAICARCEVRDECLADAATFESQAETGMRFGIWAATEPWERAGEPKPAVRHQEARCGTNGGYYRHVRTLREPSCQACREAHRKAEREGVRRRREAARLGCESGMMGAQQKTAQSAGALTPGAHSGPRQSLVRSAD